MGGASSKKKGPKSRMKKGTGFSQRGYNLHWALQPDQPDRYYQFKRFDKFRDLPEVVKPVWGFDLAEHTMVLAAAVGDQGVYLWDLLMDPPELKVVLRGHNGNVWAVAFSPNELVLATGGTEGTLRIWAAETGDPLSILEAHTEGIRCLAFSQDGVLLTGGMDSQICMWEYENNVPTAQWKAHEGHVRSIHFVMTNKGTRNKTLALSVGADNAAAAWHVEAGDYRALGRFPAGGGKGVLCIAQHSTEDNWCACGCEDGAVWIWKFPNLELGMDSPSLAEKEIDIVDNIKLAGHTHGVRALDFDYDGSILASASADGSIRIWNITHMHEDSHIVPCILVFQAHDSWITGIRFEGGAKGVVTCSADGFVKHFGAPEQVRKLKAKINFVQVREEFDQQKQRGQVTILGQNSNSLALGVDGAADDEDGPSLPSMADDENLARPPRATSTVPGPPELDESTVDVAPARVSPTGSIPPPPPGGPNPIGLHLGSLGWAGGRPQGRIDPRGSGQLLQSRLVTPPRRQVPPRSVAAKISKLVAAEIEETSTTNLTVH